MTTGRKFDSDKLRCDLLPFAELEEVVDVLTYGANKYADNNWQVVPEAKNRYLSALLRHIFAYARGEENDPESNKSHLAHACCNVLFLMWFNKKQTKEKH